MFVTFYEYAGGHARLGERIFFFDGKTVKTWRKYFRAEQQVIPLRKLVQVQSKRGRYENKSINPMVDLRFFDASSPKFPFTDGSGCFVWF